MKHCLFRKVTAIIVSLCFLLSLPALFPNISAQDYLSDPVSSLSTEALVNRILARDYTYDFIYVNSINSLYPLLKVKYPEFTELETRNDSAGVLIDKYTQVSEQNTNGNSDFSIISFLLSQDVYQVASSQQAVITPSAETLATYPTDSWYHEYSGIWYNYRRSVSTLHGESVPLFQPDRQLTAEQITEYDTETDDAFPNCNRIASANSYYNCHAYAWYSQSATCSYWLDAIAAYGNDPHHVARSDTDAAEVGDIVVYIGVIGFNRDGSAIFGYTHSAVITEIEDHWLWGRTITCTSKWGQAGLYEHEIDDVPDSYYAGFTAPTYQILYRMRAHTYTTITGYTTTGHTRKCKHCSATITESHTINSLGKCVCGYSGPGALNSLPPEDEHCCGS